MIYFAYKKNIGGFDGFYNDDIHEEIPKNSIKISIELWQELLKDNYKVNLDVLSALEDKELTIEDKTIVFIKDEIKQENEVIIPDSNKINSEEIAKLKIQNKIKDQMLKQLTRELANSRIEEKKKDTLLTTLSKTINKLNIELQKIKGGN